MKPSRLLTDESRWCTSFWTLDANSAPGSPWSRTAVRFGLDTAVLLFTGLPVAETTRRIMSTPTFRQWSQENAKAEFRAAFDLSGFNDSTWWSCIEAALKEADL